MEAGGEVVGVVAQASDGLRVGIPSAVGEAACGGARGGGVGGIHDVVEVALAKAAGHHPLPVAFGSETVKRFAFLDGTHHPKVGQSIAFGVFWNRYENCNAPDTNFHDLTPCMGLPQDLRDPGQYLVGVRRHAVPP